MDWRSMASAPKDGTRILVYGEDEFGVAHWVPDIREKWMTVDETNGRRSQELVVEDVGYWDCPICPYYWTPLPEPPHAAHAPR